MNMFYKDNVLYINIEEVINFTLVSKIQQKMYRIIDDYAINNVILNILTNERYDKTLLDDLINDYNGKYRGNIIVR